MGGARIKLTGEGRDIADPTPFLPGTIAVSQIIRD